MAGIMPRHSSRTATARAERRGKTAASVMNTAAPARRVTRLRPMKLRPLLACAALGLALLAPATAPAQPAPPPAASDDSLYRELGGKEKIESFTNDFYDRLLADPRVAPFFDGINMKYLRRVLAEYFCAAAGGPSDYDGVSMKDAHAHLGITRADFNVVVEHLQEAMDAAGVPFATQNRLLARLAFLYRDIVTK